MMISGAQVNEPACVDRRVQVKLSDRVESRDFFFLVTLPLSFLRQTMGVGIDQWTTEGLAALGSGKQQLFVVYSSETDKAASQPKCRMHMNTGAQRASCEKELYYAVQDACKSHPEYFADTIDTWHLADK
jgi:hypothetical protein